MYLPLTPMRFHSRDGYITNVVVLGVLSFTVFVFPIFDHVLWLLINTTSLVSFEIHKSFLLFSFF